MNNNMGKNSIFGATNLKKGRFTQFGAIRYDDLFNKCNRSFSYSEKECGSNDISLHFVEFSNVHNCDRSSNATQSKFAYKKCIKLSLAPA